MVAISLTPGVLRDMRERMGIRQERIASRLGKASSHIHRQELGLRPMRDGDIIAYWRALIEEARGLAVTLDELDRLLMCSHQPTNTAGQAPA